MPEVNPKLRVIFMGTADFAVPSLVALHEAGHEIVAVVTQPDKPSGRGMQMSASPIKKAAERLGLPLFQPKRVRSEKFIESMRALSPDVIAVAAFGQIIPQALLDLPTIAPINVHGSLLPRWRGAAPIQRAIMAGDSEVGVTTMWMDATLDTGDILLWNSVPVLPDDTAGTLFSTLAEMGADLLIETLERFADGKIHRSPQDETLATYAAMIMPEDSILNWWGQASQHIDWRIRGLSPKPGVFTQYRGKRLKVWRAVPTQEPLAEVAPGTVRAIRSDGVLVACSVGTSVLLTEVQPDSGKRMAASDWARGARLTVGETFEEIAS